MTTIDERTPAERRRWHHLLEDARRLSSGPYRTTNEVIERERARFDAAQELFKEGHVEEARRLFWWPRSEKPPKQHWSRVPQNPCSCRRRAPDGPLGLCGYCKGATDETPSVIPIRRISRA